MGIGCGRFGEAHWTEFLFEPDTVPELSRHIATCPLCRQEAQGLQRTTSRLAQVGPTHPAVISAFSRAVVAQHNEQRKAPHRTRRWSEWLRPRYRPALAWAVSLALVVVVGFNLDWWSSTVEAPMRPMVSTSYGTVAEDAESAQPMMATTFGTFSAEDVAPSEDLGAQPMVASSLIEPTDDGVGGLEPPIEYSADRAAFALGEGIPKRSAEGLSTTSYAGPPTGAASVATPTRRAHSLTQAAIVWAHDGLEDHS